VIGEGEPPTEPGTAKVYYADGQSTELAAAFIVEGWDWIVGFDQAHTDGDDYVSIPASRAMGVRSSRYTSFREGGRRISAYGVEGDDVDRYLDRLPL